MNVRDQEFSRESQTSAEWSVKKRLPVVILSSCHPVILSQRKGLTILEVTLSLGILAVAMTVVAEVGCWSLQERAQAAARQEALESAANILESARALPWEGLTPDWAAGQRLPESLAQRLQDDRLTVRVEPEATRPRTKRVTVVVDWKHAGRPARPVQLVGLLSARSAEVAGGKP